MFKIYDGRETFYQWDKGRKLIIYDDTISEVHFCNKTEECSLKAETYKEGNLTLVNVPNVLLTTDWRINVYAYDKDYTKHCSTFKVVSRSKPEDYIYTEEELKQWEQLQAQINTLETRQKQDKAILQTRIYKVEEEEIKNNAALQANIANLEAEVESAINNAEEVIRSQLELFNTTLNKHWHYRYTFNGDTTNGFQYADGVICVKISDDVIFDSIVGATMKVKVGNYISEVEITEDFISVGEDNHGIKMGIVGSEELPFIGIVLEDNTTIGVEKGTYFNVVTDGVTAIYVTELKKGLDFNISFEDFSQELKDMLNEFSDAVYNLTYEVTEIKKALGG